MASKPSAWPSDVSARHRGMPQQRVLIMMISLNKKNPAIRYRRIVCSLNPNF